MIVPEKQPIYYALFVETTFASFEEAVAKASELIAAHVAQSKELHAQGKVLMAGAFLNTPREPLRTMAICSTREAAEEYIKGDPLVKNGMVSNWYIREWANIFA
jgi:uncharacterized protein YciI